MRTIGKIVLLVILTGLLYLPAYSKIQQLRLKDAELRSRVENVVRENHRLAEEIEMLKTDPVYIEEVAREKLKVARKNEIILRVIDDGETRK